MEVFKRIFYCHTCCLCPLDFYCLECRKLRKAICTLLTNLFFWISFYIIPAIYLTSSKSIKAVTYFSFPTFSLFSTNIILSKLHIFLVVYYYTWHRCYYFQKNPSGSVRTNPLAWGWHQKTDLSSLLVGESIIQLSGIIWKES